MNLAALSWIFWKCLKESKESLPLTESGLDNGTESGLDNGTGHGCAGFLRGAVMNGCLFVLFCFVLLFFVVVVAVVVIA